MNAYAYPLLLRLAALLVFGCAEADTTPDEPDGAESVGNPEVVDPPSPLDPDQPVEAPDGCADAWVAEALPNPWWLDGEVADAAVPHHDPVQAYDGCVVNEVGYNPDACALPHTGARVCLSSFMNPEGRVTSTCLTASDCPKSMVCVGTLGPGDIDEAVEGFGLCEKTCSSTEPSECIRDDMSCDLDLGICRPIVSSFEGEGEGEARVRNQEPDRKTQRRKPRGKKRPASRRAASR